MNGMNLRSCSRLSFGDCVGTGGSRAGAEGEGRERRRLAGLCTDPPLATARPAGGLTSPSRRAGRLSPTPASALPSPRCVSARGLSRSAAGGTPGGPMQPRASAPRNRALAARERP